MADRSRRPSPGLPPISNLWITPDITRETGDPQRTGGCACSHVTIHQPLTLAVSDWRWRSAIGAGDHQPVMLAGSPAAAGSKARPAGMSATNAAGRRSGVTPS